MQQPQTRHGPFSQAPGLIPQTVIGRLATWSSRRFRAARSRAYDDGQNAHWQMRLLGLMVFIDHRQDLFWSISDSMQQYLQFMMPRTQVLPAHILASRREL